MNRRIGVDPAFTNLFAGSYERFMSKMYNMDTIREVSMMTCVGESL